MKSHEPNSNNTAESRRLYMRDYMRSWRQKNKSRRVTISLSPQDYDRLQSRAKAHQMRPAQYFKEAYQAFHDEKQILPPDVKDGFLEMLYLLRNACNNLNQQTKYLHIQNKKGGSIFGGNASSTVDPKQIQKTVLSLEKPIADFLKKFTS